MADEPKGQADASRGSGDLAGGAGGAAGTVVRCGVAGRHRSSASVSYVDVPFGMMGLARCGGGRAGSV